MGPKTAMQGAFLEDLAQRRCSGTFGRTRRTGRSLSSHARQSHMSSTPGKVLHAQAPVHGGAAHILNQTLGPP